MIRHKTLEPGDRQKNREGVSRFSEGLSYWGDEERAWLLNPASLYF
jgi:hypothetical protein